jgi:metallophosphoesterase (TIGR03768 family)
MKPSSGFRKLCLLVLMGMLVLSIAGCSTGADSKNPLKGYPIASEVLTTLDRTVLVDAIPSSSAKIYPYEISKFKQNGYGNWHYGSGDASEKRLDIMPATYIGESATHTAKLLSFFTITDSHISDEESPSQAIYLGFQGGISSGYSPVMMYTTQVLDAVVQTVNALNKKSPIDFGISLGDTCNDTQYNELRWYIDVLDGKDINPDSGVKDDPVPGPYNDYQDPFKAAGLDKSIPWYQTLGNHDHFWIGCNPVNSYLGSFYTGTAILNLGNIIADPLGVDSRGFYVGAIDGRTPNGDIIGIGPQAGFATPPQVLAADPNRRSLLRTEWMAEFSSTSTQPVGHGFTQSNLDTGFACYSFEPKADIPIKVIVLDDTQREDDPNVGGFGHGSLDPARYNWLVNELDKGQTEGKLMIIAAHIPIGVMQPGSVTGWWSNAYVTEANLIAKLHTYPNFLLWISGHRHLNAITTFKSPDASRPELGFWEIETSSLRDYPQQFRTFEIVRNSDNTVSILTANVDPAVKDGSLAALSRTYAVAAQQIFNNALDPAPLGSYNGEFVKQLSPEMQAKIQKYGTPIRK